ncbi:MAG TPA: hypothetical protein VFV05_03465 [Methylomirabilota bacterium]|nr:hypothetical protein [Methylomirabilota bacterium]
MTSRSGAFAVCIRNGEYEADLIIGKIYRVMRPKRNDGPADIRVLDESGEDYLYPRAWFVPVELPVKARRALGQFRKAFMAVTSAGVPPKR